MAERLSNREGIKGMANPTRYGIERVAYWLQRLSGLGLLAYLIGHILRNKYNCKRKNSMGQDVGSYRNLPRSYGLNYSNWDVCFPYR